MRISFLVPCHNEEKIIRSTYKKLKRTLGRHKLDCELIFEQDGSTDRTAEIIHDIARKDKKVKALNFPEKLGKGGGLLKAFEVSKGDVIVFLDADIPFDLSNFGKLLEGMKDSDVIIASRYAGVERDIPLTRIFFSRVYNLLNRILFRVKVLDTQSSMQLFKRDVLEKIGIWSPGFEYPIEILVKAQKSGFRIAEIGVPYTHRDDGKFSVYKHGLRIVVNTVRIALSH